uniref:Uncharacterized protein n=1 Tax=Candidatus Kentrum sp. DK TaxID=2126562 RepID=A0A450T867_9GAMM|nr:MAG: hypothetical protein BECKDK2373B_GA0170837_105322 [Candidatus Kentron sp. DK]VFJ62778.1 MAG: hypothetical protein BECKDK2373C_GA0170839_110014 [Candidatus Kentron sp. DK]
MEGIKSTGRKPGGGDWRKPGRDGRRFGNDRNTPATQEQLANRRRALEIMEFIRHGVTRTGNGHNMNIVLNDGSYVPVNQNTVRPLPIDFVAGGINAEIMQQLNFLGDADPVYQIKPDETSVLLPEITRQQLHGFLHNLEGRARTYFLGLEFRSGVLHFVFATKNVMNRYFPQ